MKYKKGNHKNRDNTTISKYRKSKFLPEKRKKKNIYKRLLSEQASSRRDPNSHTVALLHRFMTQEKKTFLYPRQTAGQQVRWLWWSALQQHFASHGLAAVPGCSPWEDADRISLHPWKFTHLIFLTNHHEQLNLSLQSDSAPSSVPLTPTCSAVFSIPDKGLFGIELLRMARRNRSFSSDYSASGFVITSWAHMDYSLAAN